MTLGVLVLAIWIAVGIGVVAVLNLLKWMVRSSSRRHGVRVADIQPWPAPQPTPAPEIPATNALHRAQPGFAGLDLDQTTRR